MTDLTLIFEVVAGIIIIGFAGELFFRKTGIPVFLFLILTGIIIGPILNVFPREPLLPALAVFAELTLLVVLFYGGMDMKFSSVLKGGFRALVQVIIYVFLSTTVIGLLFYFFLRWDLIQSFIFASMIGGETTAAVVVPLSRSLKLPDVTIAFLTLESVMNSIFSIVLFFTFIGIYNTGTVNSSIRLPTIASEFSVGIIFGALLGIVWVFLLNKLQSQEYTYVLSLGLIFATYSLTSVLGGNGELAVLVFGIILGNYYLVNRVIDKKINIDQLQTQLRVFHKEISFLMETLFFVFLGLTFELNAEQVINNFVLGVLLVGVLLTVRLGATSISTYGSEMSKQKPVIVLMCAQGLVPATLGVIALGLQIPLANNFLNIVTYVIIFTNLVTAIGSIIRIRQQKQGLREFMQNLDEIFQLK